MSRYPRIFDPTGIYHVRSRGNNRTAIFHDDKDYRSYLNILRRAKRKFGFSLYHYVLMPNHVHLLLCPSGNLSEIIHFINLVFSKYYCRRYDFVGHVWQGRFSCSHVNNDAYLLTCGNYIEMNPVRAGLVSKPEDWNHSSYRFYACADKSAFLEADPFFPNLGLTENERRERYKAQLSATRMQ